MEYVGMWVLAGVDKKINQSQANYGRTRQKEFGVKKKSTAQITFQTNPSFSISFWGCMSAVVYANQK